MDKDVEQETDQTPQQQLVTSVTAEELRTVDLESPIRDSNSSEPHQLATLYRSAAAESERANRSTDALVYGLLHCLLDMHFKPKDRAEPYGPMFVFENRRSLIPADISRDLANALAPHVPNLKHPVLRARVSDVAWLASRKLGECAASAIEAYCESVETLRSGTLQAWHDDDVTDHHVMEYLRRACQISVVTKGRNNPLPTRLTDLIKVSRQDAFKRGYLHGYYEAADLDLDYSISSPAEIAKQAESLADCGKPSPTSHWSLALLELAGRAHRESDDKENADRLTLKAAEWCVSCADTLHGAPLLEAHWLVRAIGMYGGVRAEKARRAELRKRLLNVQALTLDEFVPFGDTIDITDIVQKVEAQISGKSLSRALRSLILASKSPSPDVLRAEAKKGTEGSLASLFTTQILDHEGKVRATAPGADGRPGNRQQELALRHHIMRHEGIRRGLIARSTLYPARAIINARHGITAEKLLPVLLGTPFVPPKYEHVFAQGFSRWFGGDLIAATSILVPQLENSVRYVLKNAGTDVSTIKNDSTQEDRSIQTLFEQMRPQIAEILSEPITYEIENLFLFRGGPGVRNGIAHGLFSTGHFYSDDANYACWFILHLCFLPLLSHWDDIADYLDSL